MRHCRLVADLEFAGFSARYPIRSAPGLEKEIRLLKHIPKAENYNEDYQIVETNGKHYIYTELPHYSCWDVRLVGSYKTDEAQRYRDWLSDRHYKII